MEEQTADLPVVLPAVKQAVVFCKKSHLKSVELDWDLNVLKLASWKVIFKNVD